MLQEQEELTPEEQLAEKLRVKKLQEEADLELAKDAFGKSCPIWFSFQELKQKIIYISVSRLCNKVCIFFCRSLTTSKNLSLLSLTSGVGSATGIDAMCPSSKEEFTEFEKVLKEKISQFEKSVHYSSFLESLFRELCISCKKDLPCFIYPQCSFFILILNPSWPIMHIFLLFHAVEVDDLKKVSNSLSVLLSEKQKQEKVSDLTFTANDFIWTKEGAVDT